MLATALPTLGETLPGEPIEIEARPLALDPQQPARRTFGALRLRAAFELRAAHDHFGGFSGLTVSADGHRLTAVSDRGHWLMASLQRDEAGTLRGLAAATSRAPAGDGWQPRCRPGTARR